jgi:hypothetical protein
MHTPRDHTHKSGPMESSQTQKTISMGMLQTCYHLIDPVMRKVSLWNVYIRRLILDPPQPWQCCTYFTRMIRTKTQIITCKYHLWKMKWSRATMQLIQSCFVIWWMDSKLKATEGKKEMHQTSWSFFLLPLDSIGKRLSMKNNLEGCTCQSTGRRHGK